MNATNNQKMMSMLRSVYIECVYILFAKIWL